MAGPYAQLQEKGKRESNIKSKLTDLIKKYNSLLTTDFKLQKLYYLQKISNLLLDAQSEELSENLLKELYNIKFKNGQDLEAALQEFGIHRDASIILQAVEFADAIERLATAHEIFPKNLTFYECLRERNKLLDEELTDENLDKFKNISHALLYQYKRDSQLQEKIERHRHILGLSYAKIESIQNQINSQQSFREYKTKVLGNPLGNNRNFTLELDAETEPIVIRLEDRTSFGAEARLQTHEVSKYFTEDYASFMMPVVVEDHDELRPIILSEKARSGNVQSYAANLSQQNEKTLIKETEQIFSQLSDFCSKLMAAGFYHPDIKLTNFLTDAGRIIVSDRKTLISSKDPNVFDIQTTPSYAAPEVRSCITRKEDGSFAFKIAKATHTKIDMPSYMSYQLGIALKQFLLLGLGKVAEEETMPAAPLTILLKNPSIELQNLSLLIEELTRVVAKDRLTIEAFQTLVPKVNMEPREFLAELEKLKPKESLSTYKHIHEFTSLYFRRSSSKDLYSYIRKNPDIFLEPRLTVPILPYKAINSYLTKVSKALRQAEYAEASFWDKLLYWVSFNTYKFPIKTMKVASLGKNMPAMDDYTRECFAIFAKAEALNYLPPGDKSDLIIQILSVNGMVEKDPNKRGSKKELFAMQDEVLKVAQKQSIKTNKTNTIFSTTEFNPDVAVYKPMFSENQPIVESKKIETKVENRADVVARGDRKEKEPEGNSGLKKSS